MTQEFWRNVSALGIEDDTMIALIRHAARHRKDATPRRAAAPVLVPAE